MDARPADAGKLHDLREARPFAFRVLTFSMPSAVMVVIGRQAICSPSLTRAARASATRAAFKLV